jgi:uncharacterized peroxidase-related enzyme
LALCAVAKTKNEMNRTKERGDETMTQFPMHSVETAPEGSREILAQAQTRVGRVVNLMGVMAESPATLKSYTTMVGFLKQGSLSPTELQVVMFTANIENGCAYCVAAHTAEARHQKVDSAVIQALREGRGLDDPKLEALRRLARALVIGRGAVEGNELEQAMAVGYTHAQVLEVITAIAAKTITNYVDHLARPPLDAPFERFAWTRPSVESKA